jgi:hypothetical protein
MTVWHQLAVKGPESVVGAFLAGLECGLGNKGEFVLAADLDMEGESLGGRIRALFESLDHVTVFARPEFAERAAEALSTRGEKLRLKVEGQFRVDGASFLFHAETYSPTAAESIRQAMLTALPEGVAAEDVDEQKELHPDAHGAELYAPDHEFTYRLKGTLRGTFSGILEVHRRARETDLVEAGRISVVTSEL